MPEMTTIPKVELANLEERVKKLATDKSYLQLIIRLMNKVNAVPGLDNTVENMLRNVVDVIGGTNIILYYVIDGDVYYADVYGERKKLDGVADSLVKKVMETREPIEFEHEFSDSKMMTPEFSKAYTWIVPLLVGENLVGVFKLESLNIAMRDLYQHLPTFFTYAALVLKNEILGHTRLKQAYDRIEQEMVVRHQAEDELRQANESLEDRVAERTAELRNANEQLRKHEKQIKFLLDKSEQSRRALLSILEDEKQVEAALRRERVLLSRIMETSPVGITMVDRNGQITFANPQTEKVLGLTKDTITQRMYNAPEWHITDYDGNPFPDEELPFQRVMSTGQPVHDVQHAIVWPDGHRILLSINGAPLLNELGEVESAVCTIEDVTERKQAEEALHRLNRELRAISNCNQALLRAVDEQTLLNDICRIVCDEAGYRMAWVGYAENDEAKTVHPVAWAGVEDGYLAVANINWADTERGRGPSGTAIRSGESICIQDFTTDPKAAPWRENALQRGYRSSIALPLKKDESARTFGTLTIYSTEPNAFTPDEIRLLEELAGDLAFGITVVRGRIEQKQAEQKIVQLAAIVESSDDAITGKTTEGIVTSWNKGAENIYGYTESEMIGKSISILVPTENADVVPIILEKIKRGEHIEHYETVRQRKDGQSIQVALTVSPIKDIHGQIVGASTIVRDITEHKRNSAINSSRLRLMQFAVTHSLDELLEETLNEAEKLTGSLIGFYHFVEDDQEFLTLQNWSTRTKAEFCRAEGKGMHYAISDAGVWAECVQQRKTVIHNDYASLPHRKGLPEGHAEVIRELVVPVLRGEKIKAILGVGNKPANYTEKDVEAISLLADLAWEIAERKLVEEALRESETKFRAVFESSVDAIGVSKVGIHTFVNPAYLALFGYADTAELNGKPILDLIAPSHREQILENVRRRASGQTALAVYETRGLRKDGSEFDMDVHMSTYELNGEIYSVPILRDITERKRAEENLRQMNERFSLATRAAHLGVWDWDIQKDELVWDNGMYGLYGVRREDFAGAYDAWLKGIHPDDRAPSDEISKRAQRGEQEYDTEFRVVWPDGSVHYLKAYGQFVRDADGKPLRMTGINFDITERKRTEDTIRALNETLESRLLALTQPVGEVSNIQLNDLFNIDELQKIQDAFALATGVASIITDTQGTPITKPSNFCRLCEHIIRKTEKGLLNCYHSDATLGRMNPKGPILQRCFSGGLWDAGTSIYVGDQHIANWLIGQVLEEPVDEEAMLAYAGEIGADEEEFRKALSQVTRMPLKQFEKITDALYLIANQLSILAIQNVQQARFITERKRAEEALRESEWRYREIFDNVLDSLFLLKVTDDGRFRNLEVNPAFEKSTGLSRTQLIGKLIEETVPEEVASIVNAKYHRCVEAGLPIEEEMALDLPTGQRYFHSTLIPARDETGRVSRIIGISRDITERKQAEEEIRRLNQELEQRVVDRTAQLEAANKELEAFAYSVSHDLRAPLRHIDGFIEMLQKRTKTTLDDQSQHYMMVISDAARKMGALIDDLLSFSRMGRTEMSKSQVDLDELVQDVIRELRPEAEGRDIQWKISPLPMVTGDRAMLRMVLVNLLSNAMKFTRSRSQAEIEIGWMPGQETETIVFVRDNGVGFDMKYAAKLFGVFQRLHRADEFEGTGIGLANVRRIISRHGGRTWAEGEVDQGATFYFSLPQT